MTGRLRFVHLVRSEWTKLFALRASWFVLFGVPVLLTGVAAVIGWNDRDLPPPTVTEVVGGGFLLYALVIGVFGLWSMTGEYGSGLIRATLLTVPRRLPVLWAKAVVLVGTTGPALIVAYFGAFLAHQAFADASVRLSLGDPGVLTSLAGVTGATVACGLLGLAVGTILRGATAATTTYIAALILLPQVLLGALPAGPRDTVLPYLPTFAMQGMFDTSGASPVLAPAVGSLVVLGWVILMLGGAAAVLDRRDA